MRQISTRHLFILTMIVATLWTIVVYHNYTSRSSSNSEDIRREILQLSEAYIRALIQESMSKSLPDNQSHNVASSLAVVLHHLMQRLNRLEQLTWNVSDVELAPRREALEEILKYWKRGLYATTSVTVPQLEQRKLLSVSEQLPSDQENSCHVNAQIPMDCPWQASEDGEWFVTLSSPLLTSSENKPSWKRLLAPDTHCLHHETATRCRTALGFIEQQVSLLLSQWTTWWLIPSQMTTDQGTLKVLFHLGLHEDHRILTMWSELLASHLLLGHKVALSWHLPDLHRWSHDLRLIASPCRHMHIIYTDPQGVRDMQTNVPKSLFFLIRCFLRILQVNRDIKSYNFQAQTNSLPFIPESASAEVRAMLERIFANISRPICPSRAAWSQYFLSSWGESCETTCQRHWRKCMVHSGASVDSNLLNRWRFPCARVLFSSDISAVPGLKKQGESAYDCLLPMEPSQGDCLVESVKLRRICFCEE